MRVRLSRMQKDVDALQRRTREIRIAVNICDHAEHNNQAVNGHRCLMEITKAAKAELLSYYKAILDAEEKSHKQLLKKLLKEKRA